MKAERCVIVNADDFGLTEGINRGIIEAHERGILTSASLMVRGAGAAAAAEYARHHSSFSVGLHFDAAEWIYRQGAWVAAYEVVDSADTDAVHEELTRQLASFGELLGRAPSHLDSHQHMHLSEPARSVLTKAAEELQVPLRSCTPEITYCGSFYGQTGEGEPYPQGISAEHLIRLLKTLPVGWTEVGCHPGYSQSLESVYAAEREEELRVLCSREVRAAAEACDVKLCSFHEVPP